MTTRLIAGQEYITTRQLARRWNMSVDTLRKWRYEGRGPRYFKPSGPNGNALYKIADIEEWEREHTK